MQSIQVRMPVYSHTRERIVNDSHLHYSSVTAWHSDSHVSEQSIRLDSRMTDLYSNLGFPSIDFLRKKKQRVVSEKVER